MAAKGYTTPDRVALELGRSGDADLLARLPDLIAEAEALVDRWTGRPYLGGSPAVELVRVEAPLVRLATAPLLDVTAVTVRYPAIGAADLALVEDDGFEVVDLGRGLLRFAEGYVGYDAEVAYTHGTDAPPDDLRRATTWLAAEWATAGTEPAANSIQSFSVGGEVSVTYRDRGKAAVVPDRVRLVLDAHRGVVLA